jgi:hypothetical protein
MNLAIDLAASQVSGTECLPTQPGRQLSTLSGGLLPLTEYSNTADLSAAVSPLPLPLSIASFN